MLRLIEVFRHFFLLGCTSFGGPIAHLSYFRKAFVEDHKWLTEEDYLNLVAFCQFLPGPASSQVGMAIGWRRAGLLGGLLAWLAFSLPSAVILIAAALSLLSAGPEALPLITLKALKCLAVAVVAHALFGMSQKALKHRSSFGLALASAMGCLLWPEPWMQFACILLSALIFAFLPSQENEPRPSESQASGSSASHIHATSSRLAFVTLSLFGLSLIAALSWQGSGGLAILQAFYRAGAFVFGGGHVVLPLLESQLVDTGWLDKESFLAGYGLTQAVPGPLFTFSAYLGAVLPQDLTGTVSGIQGGLLCLLAIYLPSFFLVFGAYPLWERISRHSTSKQAMHGIHASVVGILFAAFYDPIWTSAIQSSADLVIVLALLLGLHSLRIPVWILVVGMFALGYTISP